MRERKVVSFPKSEFDSRTVNQFTGGQYLVWNITGRVRIQVVRTGGLNAVVSGVFFGPAGS